MAEKIIYTQNLICAGTTTEVPDMFNIRSINIKNNSKYSDLTLDELKYVNSTPAWKTNWIKNGGIVFDSAQEMEFRYGTYQVENA